MPKRDRRDIRIGNDKWITWVEIGDERPAEIDSLLAPLEDLWSQLETECVVECCGIDALSLSPDQICRVGSSLNDPTLAEKLSRVRQHIVESQERVFVSHRLNNLFHRDVLLQIVDHIAAHVC